MSKKQVHGLTESLIETRGRFKTNNKLVRAKILEMRERCLITGEKKKKKDEK